MTNNIVTFQSVFIDVTGVKSTIFERREIVFENECWLSVVSPTSEGAVTHIIHKDSMFREDFREYVLGQFKSFGMESKDLVVEYYRYVLGDATSIEAKTDCFNEINKLFAAYYNKESHGYYLDGDGNLFKKDANGRGLLIDYIAVKGTSETTWGYAHRYPNRTDNHPIEDRHSVTRIKKPHEIKITRPTMTVDQWLDTDIEALLSDSDRARIAANRAEREEDHEIRWRRIRELRDQDKSDKKRLAAWKKQKALGIKKNGNQLALL